MRTVAKQEHFSYIVPLAHAMENRNENRRYRYLLLSNFHFTGVGENILYELPVGSNRHPIAATIVCLDEDTGCQVYSECKWPDRPKRPRKGTAETPSEFRGHASAHNALDTSLQSNTRCLIQVTG